MIEPKYKSRIEATIRYHVPHEMEDLAYASVSVCESYLILIVSEFDIGWPSTIRADT